METTTMMRMRCISIWSSIPKARGGAISVSSSSCLCFGSPKLMLNSARVSVRRKRGLSCNALFGLGVPELVVIAGVAALVFGPKKLPEVGRSIGKTVKSFQQAAKEFESELKKEPDSIGGDSSQKPIATVSEQQQQQQQEDEKQDNSKENTLL